MLVCEKREQKKARKMVVSSGNDHFFCKKDLIYFYDML